MNLEVNNIPKVKAELKKDVYVALKKCGGIAEKAAKNNVTMQHAVDTGNIRKRITHRVDMSDQSVTKTRSTWVQNWIQMRTACCNLLFIDVLERQTLRTLSLRRIGLPQKC